MAPIKMNNVLELCVNIVTALLIDSTIYSLFSYLHQFGAFCVLRSYVLVRITLKTTQKRVSFGVRDN